MINRHCRLLNTLIDQSHNTKLNPPKCLPPPAYRYFQAAISCTLLTLITQVPECMNVQAFMRIQAPAAPACTDAAFSTLLLGQWVLQATQHVLTCPGQAVAAHQALSGLAAALKEYVPRRSKFALLCIVPNTIQLSEPSRLEATNTCITLSQTTQKGLYGDKKHVQCPYQPLPPGILMPIITKAVLSWWACKTPSMTRNAGAVLCRAATLQQPCHSLQTAT
jgi:hypothetical protein